MVANKVPRKHGRQGRISRRGFVKLAAAALLTGCRPVQQQSVTPTSPVSETPTRLPTATLTDALTGTPALPPTAVPSREPTETPAIPAAATPTHAPTGTSAPLPTATPSRVPTTAPAPTSTSTPTSVPTATPQVQTGGGRPSVVVRARHAGVWQRERLLPEAIDQMLDAAITNLTGLNDARAAWSSLFDPGERIAIKVNTLEYCRVPTHLPLVMAVTARLQEAGIPPEQIVIFDRLTFELEYADYPINWDGPGVRCFGTDDRYTPGWTLLDSGVQLSDILLSCDALINMPILKVHGDGAGISFAMKNHYGTFDRPQDYHDRRMGIAMAELNLLSPIKDRARLIVGDALQVVKAGWSEAVQGDSVFMSFDSVALDTIGLQEIRRVLQAEGIDPRQAEALATPWLRSGAELGLGTNDPSQIQLQEIAL